MISQRYIYLVNNARHDLEYAGYAYALSLTTHWDSFKRVWNNPVYAIAKLKYMATWAMHELATLQNVHADWICDQLIILHKQKNAGYSGDSEDPWANFRECESFGISAAHGCLTRLCDKYARYCRVSQNTKLDQVNESAIDTLMDFAAYCLILVCLLQEK